MGGCGGTPSPCEGAEGVGLPTAPLLVSPGPFSHAGSSSETPLSFPCRNASLLLPQPLPDPLPLHAPQGGTLGPGHAAPTGSPRLKATYTLQDIYSPYLPSALNNNCYQQQYQAQRTDKANSRLSTPGSVQPCHGHPCAQPLPLRRQRAPHRSPGSAVSPGGARLGGCSGAGRAQTLLEAAGHSCLLSPGSAVGHQGFAEVPTGSPALIHSKPRRFLKF